MRLNIEATEPVHWSIKATVGGDDLRRFARLLLKPSNLFTQCGCSVSARSCTPAVSVVGRLSRAVRSAE